MSRRWRLDPAGTTAYYRQPPHGRIAAGGLTNLIWLSLYTNNIADVSPLAGLTNLAYLWLDANNITDISPLAGLTRLEVMNLASNIITDVSPLVGLTNLIELDLRGNPLSVASINVHIAALVSRGLRYSLNRSAKATSTLNSFISIPSLNFRSEWSNMRPGAGCRFSRGPTGH